MAKPLHHQLLDQARLLVRLDRKRPQQANLRRATSSAYYAMFHFLIDNACCSILGTSRQNRRHRVALSRAFQHGDMKLACRKFVDATIKPKPPPPYIVSSDLKDVAQTFYEAQEKRHLADYDLSKTFYRSDVLAKIQDVEQAISKFDLIKHEPEARFFMACLLGWSGLKGRN